MNLNTINNILISKFPELALLFKEQFDLWGNNIHPHCFTGDVLNNYVTGLLLENNNKQQIKKIFDFYEEMACCDDLEVRNLLQVTLLEYLWDNERVFNKALDYMQPKTREINNLISSYLKLPVGYAKGE